ncbi:type II toxin-antitoxin system RelE/ParE family toxin [Glaciimonas sp. PAMC28666]|uniref:type II toxin-antitoxin system RelE/ParE family toxin n=1 Tax=Glaciimonas sp. PAMC28666 TaxID=2807626 RepID=UPI001F03804F|nr:type II toxin-antitoxin system RelE/ParE family toxin [Glaciimonas sp. PAMC28666]
MAYINRMRYEFIESTLFSSNVYDYLNDDEYKELQEYLSDNHEAGDVVRGSGGVRKVRWARAGAGKSGGVRVCYYARTRAGQILMLVIYAKSNRASIPGHILKQLKEILDETD